MEIIKAKSEHATQACSLYKHAISYFKQNNIDQWQKGYPCLASLLQDIAKGESFVVLQGNIVVATFMLSLSSEPTYSTIYNGAWQGAEAYGVIHRVAVSPSIKGSGIFGSIVGFAAEHCRAHKKSSLRCDTHEQNASMQRALTKNGFIYSGIIYLDEQKHDPRLAYEKQL